MAPSKKKRAAVAAAAKRQWNVGDLVLAKVKGFPAWPAKVTKPEKSGYRPEKKVHVLFFGTYQVGYCSHADVEAFTEEKKQSLLKRQGKSNDFTAAVKEIIDLYEKCTTPNGADHLKISECSTDSLAPVLLNICTESSEPALTGSSVITSYTAKRGSSSVRSRKNGSQKEVDKFSASSCLETVRRFGQRFHEDNNCTVDEYFPHKSSATLPRNQKKSTSFEASVPDDLDSPAFVSCGSTEENGLHNAAGDSGTIYNDVKPFSEGDLCNSDLCKGFQFGLTSYHKGKRKPSRKRLIIEPCELLATHEHETEAEAAASEDSKVHIFETDKAAIKDIGDEHLPLVKRARVRMEKLSEFDNCHSPVERAANLKVKLSPFLDLEKTISVPLASTQNLPNLCENSSQTSIMTSSAGRDDPCNQPRNNEAKSFLFSADCEADLPPSKRLHRALEAMSANAIDEERTKEDVLSTQLLGSNIDVPPIRSPCTNSPCNGCNNAMEMVGVVNKVIHSTSHVFDKEPMSPLPAAPVCNQEKCFPTEECEDMTANNNEEDLRGNISESLDVCCDITVVKDENDLDSKSSDALLNFGSDDPMSQYKSLEIRQCVVVLEDPPVDERRDTSSVSGVCANLSSLLEETNNGFDSNEKSVFYVDDTKENEKCSSTVESEDAPFEKTNRDGTVGLDDKPTKVCETSPCAVDVIESPRGTSPNDNSQCHISTSESVTDIQPSSCSSPCAFTLFKKNVNGSVAYEEKIDSVGSQTAKSVEKYDSYAEGHAALTSFEDVLASLTRTKESIGRATRIAIDCAKFGFSSQVMDIIIRTLETESNLPRRVDLFFLVDSITQCSRSIKGEIGAKYPSAVQLALPRLLSAAAPPGISSEENRKQCLKVLKLWLDRKILSESVVRQHIEEVKALSLCSAGPYSRRSARTERSLDDPVRDMEGMLVDEYGSNTTLQLDGICLPRVHIVEDDGSDSDVGFEAVTPEHTPAAFETQQNIPTLERHTCVLEDVDVELEMEDVAPCETETCASVSAGTAHQNIASSSVSFSSEDMQQSPPPPLPPSPPPFLPPPPPLPDSSTSHPQNVSDDPRPVSNGAHHNHKEPRDKAQTCYPESTPSSSGNHQSYQDHNHERSDSPRFHHKSYYSVNSFPPSGYVQSNHYSKYRRGNAPPLTRRSWHSDGGHSYNNHGRMSPGSYEFNNNWRHRMPRFHGPYQENGHKEVASYHQGGSYGGPYREPSRYHHQNWGYQSQGMHHRN